MLTRNRPETINASLTITGQGVEDVTFDLVYRNLTGDQFDTALNIDGKDKDREQIDYISAVLELVASWDTEYKLTREDLAAAESDRGGFLIAVIQGFHQCRRVKLVGN